MYLIHIILVVAINSFAVYSSQVVSYNMGFQVKHFHIVKCDTRANYNITLENVQIRIGVNPKVFVSGTFSTDVNLYPPVKAVLEVWHKVIFWVKLPCESGKGSCTYDDLCEYSVPADKSCPPYLDEDKVPCRCPIMKGKYIIPENVSLPLFNSIPLVDGSYEGTINVYSHSTNLACYNFDFVLVDKMHRLKNEYFIHNHQDNYL